MTNNKGIIKHIPNALTVGRLILTVMLLGMIVYAPQLGAQPTKFLLWAFTLFVITGLTDILDGHLARRFEVTSKFGRTVDPLADKILVCGSFICFAIAGYPKFYSFNFSDTTLHIIHWSTAIILLTREILVQTIRQIAESRGVNFAAVTSGKIKMFLQSFGIGTVLVGWACVRGVWGDWFTIIVYTLMVAATIYSGIDSLRRPINK